MAAVPLTLGLSHPAVFVAGGMSLGLAGKVWNARRRGRCSRSSCITWRWWGPSSLSSSSSRASKSGLSSRRYDRTTGPEAFPPLGEPVKLVCWLAEAHTGRMFAYPFGEARGGSSFTTLCFVVALVRTVAAEGEGLAGAGAGAVRARFHCIGAGPLSVRRKRPNHDFRGTDDLPAERTGARGHDRQAPPCPDAPTGRSSRACSDWP